MGFQQFVYRQKYGHSCGIIGNNGPIDPNGATKAAQFIQLCGQSKIPIIFFSNTTGFMVGKQSEQLGMIKHGSKMIQAVSNLTFQKLPYILVLVLAQELRSVDSPMSLTFFFMANSVTG